MSSPAIQSALSPTVLVILTIGPSQVKQTTLAQQVAYSSRVIGQPQLHLYQMSYLAQMAQSLYATQTAGLRCLWRILAKNRLSENEILWLCAAGWEGPPCHRLLP